MGVSVSTLGSIGLAPYTDDDDATTTRRTPAARMASSTRMVPVALLSWLARGSSMDLGTDGRAARCTTASAPASTSVRWAWSKMSPSTSATPARSATFSAKPVDRLSNATT